MSNKNNIWIGGKHSVETAITCGKRKITQIITLKKNKFLDQKNIKYEIKNESFFNKIFFNSHISHQGIAALVSVLPNVSIDNLLEDKSIVMLDGITDPMNIGSIIRNCVAFGIKSIIVKEREFNEKSQAMIKVSAGAIEHINLCKIANLLNAIKLLKKRGYWTVCLDGKGDKNISDYNWSDKNLIIFGSEGKGVGELIKKNCDDSIKIKIASNMESLNVSNAVAITLFSIQKKLINAYK